MRHASGAARRTHRSKYLIRKEAARRARRTHEARTHGATAPHFACTHGAPHKEAHSSGAKGRGYDVVDAILLLSHTQVLQCARGRFLYAERR